MTQLEVLRLLVLADIVAFNDLKDFDYDVAHRIMFNAMKGAILLREELLDSPSLEAILDFLVANILFWSSNECVWRPQNIRSYFANVAQVCFDLLASLVDALVDESPAQKIKTSCVEGWKNLSPTQRQGKVLPIPQTRRLSKELPKDFKF